MSISITLEVGALDEALVRLEPIFDFDAGPMMDAVGALGESQTRRRITEEKTAPDGTPWRENRQGTSILLETGRNLLASVAWTASPAEAQWGASWEHASVHQEGATIVPKDAEALAIPVGDGVRMVKKAVIPARPFVGISDDNAREIEELVGDFLGLAR